jgi:hypothetical protein
VTADPAEILRSLWNDANPMVADPTGVPDTVRASITNAINAKFKLARYILPTQLLAKLENLQRNALVLQAQSGFEGRFDARSFCKRYITKFDEENHDVLGGSDDPGVGNLWRYPQIDDTWLAKGHRAKSGGADLFAVLSFAQDNPDKVETLLRLTLLAIAERLKKTKIVYPRPNRIALLACEALVSHFLATRTGGRRLQAVAAALFDTIGERFGLFSDVQVGHVNKADAARGDVADLDCRDNDGRTVMSVEVKDRQLSVREVMDTLQVARDKGITEIIYLIRGGIPENERAAYEDFKSRQFTAGHNVYDIDFETLLRACLILFGERGRLAFLEAAGRRIDAHGELADREAWQQALEHA